MKIAKNTVVSLNYQMYGEKNQLLDATQDEAMVYLHGGYDGIFPLVEEALHNLETGAKIDMKLSVEDAFGEIDTDLIRVEDVSSFPPEMELAAGMLLESDNPETGETEIFRITDIAEGKAVLDGNHPFAGMKIRFVAEVVDVRAATAEEIAHGHIHHHGHH